MLAKKNRLNRSQFEHYFASGRRYHSPELQLIFTPADHFHGAVVVGKKVARKAVRRNRLRRQLYGAIYRFSKKQSGDGVYILLAKPTLEKVPTRLVSVKAEELLKRTQTK